MKDQLKQHIQILPDSPGVYRFYNSENTLIYVGKAKSLRKRVGSYFNKIEGVNRKTLRLVSEIEKIEYTVSGTEFDALLLENNLIKQNQPKYNILLKDDKTFPYICILKEPFPRVIYTRKYIPEQGEYFGPYSSVVAMKNILELARKLYTIRTCHLLLTPNNIEQKKFKVCLEYHIGNCKGPCEGLQNETDYLRDIDQLRSILKGQVSIVEKYFSGQMNAAASAMQFEKAQFFKEKLDYLERFQTKSLVVNRDITDVDVITLISSSEYSYTNYMVIREGAIIYSKSMELKKKLDETDEELVSLALLEMQEQSRSGNKIVFSNIPINLLPEGSENIIPKIGDKRKLLLLSQKNAMELQRERELLRAEKKAKKNEVLFILQKDMQLPTLPDVIECFDNSNFQGTTPVASMVRFVNGKPDKKGYRHFNIKTVEGPNDFASMKEIVYRRYFRLVHEDQPLPDLILIDGGKGQLSSACEALKELNLYGKIPIAGIAKKLEEIYYPEDSLPLMINKRSPGLKLLQFVRDEAHRFAITFHRQKRSKTFLKTEIEELKGVGKATTEKLLRHFKSVKKVKEASQEELEAVVGKSKAAIIKAIKNP
ncbi:MAG TPA: excinuclease ABC subunit UvrC [Cyclobacteriaceae bacterium]|nr:excinuclease ABC subunit UvrC [Cyclobacteriaceae bacterium]HMV07642.1 excinuclease ABC subunit UvrC [Cyclobacteriaceae bacterium]HMV89371.1 excinuclease ABC subunit UvrC [Cyclobacteriaceae bacterium]HMW98777.1 excinuclease ABC subunit UvrC [Cyclobacteriaceae bacterium]HMX48590.1 excinuclease ABC subunit UvrC [Cyclobacteriaceae bacterium]